MIFDREKRTAELYRLEDDTAAETRTWQKVSDISIWIYARSDQEIALHDGNFSKSYTGRVRVDLDIREADRVEINGEKYDVNGVRVHGFGGVASRRLLLELAADQ